MEIPCLTCFFRKRRRNFTPPRNNCKRSRRRWAVSSAFTTLTRTCAPEPLNAARTCRSSLTLKKSEFMVCVCVTSQPQWRYKHLSISLYPYRINKPQQKINNSKFYSWGKRASLSLVPSQTALNFFLRVSSSWFCCSSTTGSPTGPKDRKLQSFYLVTGPNWRKRLRNAHQEKKYLCRKCNPSARCSTQTTEAENNLN